MNRTEILRGQHESAMVMAHRLLELIEAFRPGHCVQPILDQVSRLHGILRVHLAQEDIELYPSLLASHDLAVASLARQFVDEMGSLAIDLECFARHWSSPAGISANFAEFSEAAHDLLVRLAVRIELEDRQLYPLVDGTAELHRNAA